MTTNPDPDDEQTLIPRRVVADQRGPVVDLTAFREEGYLQELNRLFLNPLGLCMELEVDEVGTRFRCIRDTRFARRRLIRLARSCLCMKSRHSP